MSEVTTTQMIIPAPISKESSFNILNSIELKKLTEQKNGLTYLNWAHAVRVLQENCPSATWEVKRFEGMPYLKTELGYFVEVAVTIDGRTLSQIHAVFDFRGQTIIKPKATDINNSIQRCLTKAIGLHGLGLYIYAREEDAQMDEEVQSGLTKSKAANIVDGLIKPNTNVKMISEAQLVLIKKIVLTPEFTDEKVTAALAQYKVKGFSDMTYVKAEHFIKRFNK